MKNLKYVKLFENFTTAEIKQGAYLVSEIESLGFTYPPSPSLSKDDIINFIISGDELTIQIFVKCQNPQGLVNDLNKYPDHSKSAMPVFAGQKSTGSIFVSASGEIQVKANDIKEFRYPDIYAGLIVTILKKWSEQTGQENLGIRIGSSFHNLSEISILDAEKLMKNRLKQAPITATNPYRGPQQQISVIKIKTSLDDWFLFELYIKNFGQKLLENLKSAVSKFAIANNVALDVQVYDDGMSEGMVVIHVGYPDSEKDSTTRSVHGYFQSIFKVIVSKDKYQRFADNYIKDPESDAIYDNLEKDRGFIISLKKLIVEIQKNEIPGELEVPAQPQSVTPEGSLTPFPLTQK